MSFIEKVSGFLDVYFCDVITNSFERLGNENLSGDILLLEAIRHINQITLEKTVSYIEKNPTLRSVESLETKAEILRWVHQAAYNYGGVKFESPLSCKTLTPQPIFSFYESNDPYIIKVDNKSYTPQRNYRDPGSSIEFIVYLGGNNAIVEFEHLGEKMEMEIGDAIILPAVWTHNYEISSKGESHFLINTIAFDESKYQIIDF